MGELIAFRAVQGLGGGGLMVTTMAVDRRHRLAARARALSGADRRRVRRLDRARAAGRRLFRRASELALDLLHQPAARPAGDPGDRLGVARAAARAPAPRSTSTAPALLAVALTALILFTSLGGSTSPWRSPRSSR